MSKTQPVPVKPDPSLKDTALSFPFREPPAFGEPREVAPGIYWVRLTLPFALDHINVWLLKDGDGWAIVDCGYGTEENQGLWEHIFAANLDGKPVTRVIVTHFHPDHVGLAGWLTKRWSVDLWMSQAEFLTAHAVRDDATGFTQEAFVDLFRRHGIESARLKTVTMRTDAYRKGVLALPSQYRRLMDGDEVVINRNTWRIIMGYGHAPEHAALYCQTLGVLIAGDMVLPRITTNVSVTGLEPEGNPLKLYLDSVRRYATLPADTLVLPSHGLIFHGLRTRADALQRHHDERLVDLAAAATEPRAASDLLSILFRRKLDDYQTSFAMGEAIAHLNYLWTAKTLDRITGNDGVYRFVRHA